MRIAIITLILLLSLGARAVTPAQVCWHNEASDTLKINELLLNILAEKPSGEPQEYVPVAARQLLGTPYGGGGNKCPRDVEMLAVSFKSLDCITYVEVVMALAKTAAKGRASWRDFIANLESVRYRSGNMGGYESRLHYVSDWILDNGSRGNIKEVTGRMPGSDYVVKTIDYMTANRGLYPQLADDELYKAIKNVESGYRSHRFPYIKKLRLISDKKVPAALREGDIVAITTSKAGLDVSHVGIITIVDGEPHLLHASSKQGKILVDPLTLAEYLKRSKTATGIRVVRLD